MTDRIPRPGLVVAALAGGAGVAGSYLAAGPSPAFVVAPVHAVVVALTPDRVVAFAILFFGELGNQFAFAAALGLAAALLGAAGLAGGRATREFGSPLLGAGFATLVAWIVAALLTGRPVLALAAALPVGVVVAAGTASTGPASFSPGRRRALGLAAGVAAFTGLGVVLGRSSDDEELDPVSIEPTAQRMLDEADHLSLDLDGIDGLVTPTEEFYRVDVAAYPPDLDPDTWTLAVTGAVDDPFEIGYAELTAMETEHRYETLRCVGESLNGKKIDTAVWKGVRVAALLDRAGVGLSDTCCVMLRAADDYYEEFPLGALRDAMLAFEMNGRPLPPDHGYPVRALVPGHWGEINVKWLTEIEVLETEGVGYWEERGWHGTGPVETVAKLHVVNHLDDGRVEVGGHAYAGTRGIQRVEVSTDGGETWTDAELSESLPDPDVWRQWRHVFEPSGTHEVVVRATDGEGTRQAREEADAFPSGPTGWVDRTIRA